MFDPYASLARLGLFFALLARWLSPPATARVLARRDAELARGLRFTLAHAGIKAPALDDRALIAWVARTRPLAEDGGEAAGVRSRRHAPTFSVGFSRQKFGRLKPALSKRVRVMWTAAAFADAPNAALARAPPDASGAATSPSR
jgi:hypothetical protein